MKYAIVYCNKVKGTNYTYEITNIIFTDMRDDWPGQNWVFFTLYDVGRKHMRHLLHKRRLSHRKEKR